MAYTHDPSDITVQMTSNSAPSPNRVTASSEYSATYAAWKAFNRTFNGDSDCWSDTDINGFTDAWLRYDWGGTIAYVVTSYKVCAYYDGNYGITEWTFQGSQNASSWTTLDSRTGQTLDATGTVYTFSNSTAYKYYRIVPTAGGGGLGRAIIGKLELYSPNVFGIQNGGSIFSGWTNSSNASTEGGGVATSALMTDWNDKTGLLNATGFGFTLPVGSTILGIQVEVKRNADYGDLGYCNDDTIDLIKGGIAQAITNKSVQAGWPTTLAYAVYGGSSDLWGLSWTSSDVNATDFGVAIQGVKLMNDEGATPVHAYIDYIRITVYYTLPASGTVTWQPSNADSSMAQAAPDYAYGAYVNLRIESYTTGGSNYNQRSVLNFNFTELPTGATISAATLNAYYFDNDGYDPVGRTYWVYELTQTGWIEAEVTWNSYKSGSAWSLAGGDFTTTNGAGLVAPGSYGWMSWNVLALVQHFQSSHGKIANFIVKDGFEDAVTPYFLDLHSNNYTTDTSLCPKLSITYSTGWSHTIMGITLPASIMGILNTGVIKTVNGIS